MFLNLPKISPEKVIFDFSRHGVSSPPPAFFSAPLKSGEVGDGDVTKPLTQTLLYIPFQKSFWEVSETLFSKRVSDKISKTFLGIKYKEKL